MATPKRKTELKLVKAVEEGVKSPRMPPASRPVLLESDVFRKEIGKRLDEVNGEINILDASEDQAEADFRAAIKMLTEKRDAERRAQAQRKADLIRIHDGCTAALNASAEQPAAAE